MKALYASAAGLALLATAASADTANVTLTATVTEYIAITQANNSDIVVADPFGNSGTPGNNNRNASLADKSNFFVDANVEFDIELSWQTWQVGGAGYNQAAYEGDDCKIGGTITFDTNPASNSNNTDTPPSGASPWNVRDSNKFPDSAFQAGMGREFGIGIESSPNVNDCPGGVAPADDYVLPVTITVSAVTP